MTAVAAAAKASVSAEYAPAGSLRILHVLDHSVPSGYTFRTLSILERQRARGWETYQLTGPKQGSGAARKHQVGDWLFYRTPPAEGLTVRMPAMGYPALMAALRARISEVVDMVRPDVIHAHSPVLNAIPALAVGRQRRIPVVYEVRAFWEDAADTGTAHEWGLRYRLTRALETRALRRADAVTTICEGLRREMVARGIAPDRITVIPNAVDVSRFRFRAPRDADLVAQYKLHPGATLGFAGSFYAYEGLDLLLRAMPAILRAIPQAKLLLLGGGPQEAPLQALARELRLDDNVRFVGRVPHDQVSRYCAVMDLMVYPRISRRLTELVTPLKPLEAMAMGKLVAASDVGGHRELIKDGYNGHLFAAGSPDALAACLTGLLQAPQGWDAVIANGRRYVEHERTWKQSVDRYESVYAMARARASRRWGNARAY